MPSTPNAAPGGKARLGLWDAISIIVGIIIGAGIYETPPGIFQKVSGPWMGLGLWALGGLLAFIGALCYAELATTYPRSGGDYVYLTRAYGPLMGYLFGWAQLAVIQTGSIGLMAYIFADYAKRLWSFGPYSTILYAAGAIVLISVLNMLGVVLGKVAQNLLTLAKILGLGAILVAGYGYAPAANSENQREVVEGQVVGVKEGSLTIRQETNPSLNFEIPDKTRITVNNSDEHTDKKTKEKRKFQLADLKEDQTVKVISTTGPEKHVVQIKAKEAPTLELLAFAMVLIFLTYGGWNDAAFVAAEVKNRKRNLPLALLLGTALVTLIYLSVNGAYLYGLGFENAEQSREVAADVLKLLPGEMGAYGEQGMCVLVMISALGAVNGLIFTSSRIYATLGSDYSLFAPLGKWNQRMGSPIWSLLLQMIISLAMVLAVGTKEGQDLLTQGLTYLGQPVISWEGQGGFYSLLRCTAPIFWLFFLMTGMSLFVLRLNDKNLVRPFSAPLYPVTPLIFCATCGYMLYSGIQYAGSLGLVGGGLVLLGIPLYVFSRRSASANTASAEPEMVPVSDSYE